METGLADCAATAKDVITRGGRNKDRLKVLLQDLERESVISYRMKQESASLARNLGNKGGVVAKTMVMAELNKTNPDFHYQNQAFTSPSPT